MFTPLWRNAICAAILVAATAVPAHAVSVITQFFPGHKNLLSDNSGEFLYDFGGGATTLDIGDVLIVSFNIHTNEDLSVPGGVTNFFGQGGVNEFTGMAAVEISAKLNPIANLYIFDFVPVSAANRAAIIGDATLPFTAAELASWQPETMIAFHEDPSIDYERTGAVPVDTLMATAVNGPKLWEAGFLGLVGEGWRALSISDDVATLVSILPPGNAGSFNLAVNVVPGTLTVPVSFGPVASTIFGGTTDITGSGSILGTGGTTTPFDIFDDVDFVMVVPEPSSLVLFALGMLCCPALYVLRSRASRRR